MKTARSMRRRQRTKRATAPKSLAAHPSRGAAMRTKVSYTLLMAIPAAAALAMAPSAAADPPVCTGNQIAQYDNCVDAPPPSGGCGGIMCMVATGAQDVYLPDNAPGIPGNPQGISQGDPPGAPGSVPASGPDANGPGTPPVGPPPSMGCSGIACMTANGAQDVYTP
jgi:hypothetical protein